MSRAVLRIRRGPRRAVVSGVVILVVISLRLLHQYASRDKDLGLPESLMEGSYSVVRVVDGDTLIVRAHRDHSASNTPNSRSPPFRLRLLSIDTPETVKPDHPTEPWGKEATDFTERFVHNGVVHVRFDKRRRDQYGRWLAYVYVGDKMLNQEIVRAGLARVVVYRGDSLTIGRQLKRAQQEAREAGRGIWSGQGP